MAKVSKTILDRKARVEKILPVLRERYPDAKCSLDFATPLQLLTATILSAQCTDVRVNLVTPDLFKKYPDAKTLASVAQEVLEKDIQSTGFFRSKAKSLRAMAASIIESHGGEVPNTMELLTKLAGVGRKTANVVLGNAFGIDVGVTVDTHVTRVAGRLGLTKSTDAVKIEQDLMAIVPQTMWTMWSHLLIFHGRQTCIARKPKCRVCPVRHWCPAGDKLIATGKAAD